MKKQKKLLIITAHPDDCELMFGGMIAKHARMGYEIESIIVADGSKWIRGEQSEKSSIVAMRKAETLEAGSILGISKITFFDHEDGMVDAQSLIAPLISNIRAADPHFILTHAEDEGHPDHKAVSIAVKRVCNVMGEPPPITNPFWQTPEKPCAQFIELFTSAMLKDIDTKACRFVVLEDKDIALKVRALQAYKSQFPVDEHDSLNKRVIHETGFWGGMMGADYAEVIAPAFLPPCEKREVLE